MIRSEHSEVITFYSYTGGAGRSMALANVACMLARHCPPDRGVLMVDWNLDAPSLHRFGQVLSEAYEFTSADEIGDTA